MGYLYLGLLLVVVVFALIDSNHFIQYDGEMKRGIKVGSEPLSTDLEGYLRNLSSDVLKEQTTAFIKKRDQIVLIQPIPNFSHRNVGLWYVGFVDLSSAEPQIDYRTPISGILMLAIMVGVFVFRAFNGSPNETIGAVCVLGIMIPILVIAHATSKRVVRKYIEKSIQSSCG